MQQTIKIVQKEDLAGTTFANHEVLSTPFDIERRKYNLRKALTLGNLYRHKVGIIFQLRNQEVQRVETTIWSVSEFYITLKGGINIPIHSILEIDFC